VRAHQDQVGLARFGEGDDLGGDVAQAIGRFERDAGAAQLVLGRRERLGRLLALVVVDRLLAGDGGGVRERAGARAARAPRGAR
jgi:hypothetical protein